MLSTVAAGSVGMFNGIDQVDFEALSEEVEETDTKDDDVLQQFTLKGEGVTKTTANITNNVDPSCGDNETPPNSQFFEHMGNLKGWFKGGYRGGNISLQLDYDSPPAMQASMELVKPANEIAQSSSYYVVWQGVADGGPSDFEVELPFKSIRATNEFAGTMIKGTFKSKTPPGYPLKFKMKGVQVETEEGE